MGQPGEWRDGGDQVEVVGNSMAGESANANKMAGGSAETRDIDARGTERPLADVAMLDAMAGVDDATLGGRIEQTARAFALDRCNASPICTTSFWERCRGWQGGRRDRSHDGRGSVGGKAREGKTEKRNVPIARSSRGRIAHPWPWASFVAIGGWAADGKIPALPA